jgi:hypothetical protein
LLAESPHLLHQDPFDHGWLYEVADPEDGPEALVSPELIAGTYAADHSRFLAALTGIFGGDEPHPGYTLAGIEEHLESIMDFVGPKRYLNTVRQVYA